MIALVMFDWGYTAGGYQGQADQWGADKWNCGPDSPNCLPLHQFVPFPSNLEDTVTHFNLNDL